MKLFKVLTEHDSHVVGRENKIIQTEHFYAAENIHIVHEYIKNEGSMLDLEIKGVIEVVAMVKILKNEERYDAYQ